MWHSCLCHNYYIGLIQRSLFDIAPVYNILFAHHDQQKQLFSQLVVVFAVTSLRNSIKLEDRFKVEHRLNRDSVFVYLETNEIPVQLLVTPVYYNVTLSNCPLGFELIGDPPSCQCQKELVHNNIKHYSIWLCGSQ